MKQRGHLYCGENVPGARYPLRYSGWEHYPPRKKDAAAYDRWCVEHVSAFLKRLYGAQAEETVTKGSPFAAMLRKEDD